MKSTKLRLKPTRILLAWFTLLLIIHRNRHVWEEIAPLGKQIQEFGRRNLQRYRQNKQSGTLAEQWVVVGPIGLDLVGRGLAIVGNGVGDPGDLRDVVIEPSDADVASLVLPDREETMERLTWLLPDLGELGAFVGRC